MRQLEEEKRDKFTDEAINDLIKAIKNLQKKN